MQRLVNIPEVKTVQELRYYVLQALNELAGIIEARSIVNYENPTPPETSIRFEEDTNKLKVYNTLTKTWITINP